jgi:prevent-host-death family protein
MITMTSAQAQNSFGKLLDTVQREAVAITRHGRPTAFVVSPLDMEEILAAKRRRSEAVAEFKEWSARAQASQTPEQAAAAAALTDEEVNRMVHELR